MKLPRIGGKRRPADEPASRQESFVFEVTQRCNHQCRHCYNVWKGPGGYPAGESDTQQALAILSRMLGQTGARLVSLTGGEPLLRPDLPQIVDFLAGRGVDVNLITNGSLLDEAWIARLAGKVTVFEVPLLSCDAAVHDRLSGCPGAFDRVTMAIANLKAAGRRAVAVFVATRLNLPAWPETLELAFALGVDGVMFNRFNPGGEGARHIAELQAPPADIRRALDVAEERCGRYGLPIACSIALPPCLVPTDGYRRLGFGFCAAGTPRAYYTVDPIGNVRPCNHTPTILGNILSDNFEEMARGEALREFVAARPAFCSGCAVEDECLGGCKAAAQVCAGSLTACDPFLAAFGEELRRGAGVKTED